MGVAVVRFLTFGDPRDEVLEALTSQLGISANTFAFEARVDGDAKRQVLFFQEQLEEQRIEPGIDVPVDESKVVTW